MHIFGKIPKSQQAINQYLNKIYFVCDILNIDGLFISSEELKQSNPKDKFYIICKNKN